jgi:hypothetical protein
MQVTLDRAGRFSKQFGTFRDGKPFEVYQDEHFTLSARKLIKGTGNPTPQARVSELRTRDVRGFIFPHATPKISYRTPATVILGLAYEDAIEPRLETGLSAKALQSSVGSHKSILGDIFSSGLITADQSPRETSCPLTMRRHERAEAFLTFSGCDLRCQYSNSDSHYRLFAIPLY